MGDNLRAPERVINPLAFAQWAAQGEQPKRLNVTFDLDWSDSPDEDTQPYLATPRKQAKAVPS